MGSGKRNSPTVPGEGRGEPDAGSQRRLHGWTTTSTTTTTTTTNINSCSRVLGQQREVELTYRESVGE